MNNYVSTFPGGHPWLPSGGKGADSPPAVPAVVAAFGPRVGQSLGVCPKGEDRGSMGTIPGARRDGQRGASILGRRIWRIRQAAAKNVVRDRGGGVSTWPGPPNVLSVANDAKLRGHLHGPHSPVEAAVYGQGDGVKLAIGSLDHVG